MVAAAAGKVAALLQSAGATFRMDDVAAHTSSTSSFEGLERFKFPHEAWARLEAFRCSVHVL